jgi:hypothetical protein
MSGAERAGVQVNWKQLAVYLGYHEVQNECRLQRSQSVNIHSVAVIVRGIGASCDQ